MHEVILPSVLPGLVLLWEMIITSEGQVTIPQQLLHVLDECRERFVIPPVSALGPAHFACGYENAQQSKPPGSFLH
jgi:hypothetical protein